MDNQTPNAAWLMAVLTTCCYALCCAAAYLSGPDTLFGMAVRMLSTRELFAVEIFYAVFVTVLVISIGIFRDKRTLREVVNKANRRLRRAQRKTDCYRRYVDKLNEEMKLLQQSYGNDQMKLDQLKKRYQSDNEGTKYISPLSLPQSAEQLIAPQWLKSFGKTVDAFGSLVAKAKDIKAKFKSSETVIQIAMRQRRTILESKEHMVALKAERDASRKASDTQAGIRMLQHEIVKLKAAKGRAVAKHEKGTALLQQKTDEFEKQQQVLENNIRSGKLLVIQHATELSQLQERVDNAEKLAAEAKYAASIARSDDCGPALQSSALLLDNAVRLAVAKEQQLANAKAEEARQLAAAKEKEVRQEFNRLLQEKTAAVQALADAKFDNFRQETLAKETSQQLVITEAEEARRSAIEKADEAQQVAITKAEEAQQKFDRVIKEKTADIQALADAKFDKLQKDTLAPEDSQQMLVDRQAATIVEMQQRIDAAELLARNIQNAMDIAVTSANEAAKNVDDAVKRAVDSVRAQEQALASQNLASAVDLAVKETRKSLEDAKHSTEDAVKCAVDAARAQEQALASENLSAAVDIAVKETRKSLEDAKNSNEDAIKSAVDTARAQEQALASENLAAAVDIAVKETRRTYEADHAQKRIMLQQDFYRQLSVKDEAIKALEAPIIDERAKLAASDQEVKNYIRLLGEKDIRLASMQQRIQDLTIEGERLANARGMAEDEGRSYAAELDECEGRLCDIIDERDRLEEQAISRDKDFKKQQEELDDSLADIVEHSFKISDLETEVEGLTEERDKIRLQLDAAANNPGSAAFLAAVNAAEQKVLARSEESNQRIVMLIDQVREESRNARDWEEKAGQHQEAARRFMQMVSETREAAQLEKSWSDAENERLRAQLAAATSV